MYRFLMLLCPDGRGSLITVTTLIYESPNLELDPQGASIKALVLAVVVSLITVTAYTIGLWR